MTKELAFRQKTLCHLGVVFSYLQNKNGGFDLLKNIFIIALRPAKKKIPHTKRIFISNSAQQRVVKLYSVLE